jgi:protein involved in polysaccharide export with SLBB domain
MKPIESRSRLVVVPFVMLLVLGNVCLGQDTTVSPVVGARSSAPLLGGRHQFESRAELEAQAAAAETNHRTGEAWLLRSRLKNGDFQDGDRILVEVEGANIMTKPETLVVRTGKRLELPRMADLSLEGVLRSELADRLKQHLAQYIKEPVVRATPLVRVAVLGTVGRPGYIYIAADIPLSDVIMAAGGPGSNADLGRVSVRRGSEVIWDAKDTKTALADGLSIDQLHMRAGDEINVGAKRNWGWGTAAVTLLVPIASILITRALYR